MNNKKGISRRRFLKRTSEASLASMFAAHSIGLTGLLGASKSMADMGDYRALVFIMLKGGNDSFNMVLPSGTGSLRASYEQGRGIVALPNEGLQGLNLAGPAQIYGDTQSTDFAMHPQCPQMAEIFNAGEMSVLCNVGNLIQPLTRNEWFDGNASVPPRLFSHSDQQRQTQSQPDDPFLYGWGGRMAEINESYNSDPNVSPLISMSGLNSFQITRDSLINTYVMGNDGAVSLYGFNGAREAMVESSMQSVDSASHLMEQKYQAVYGSARQAQAVVGAAFDLAETTGVDYDAIFDAAGTNNSKISRRLKTVAKMIAGREATSNSRPVFFVELDGFDNHQKLLGDHSQRMAELNAALKGFRDVLVAQGDFDKTLSYVTSEFARTFTANGEDNDAGTDHGWGGHALVMGGMVNGGNFFGQHPDLRLDEGLDTGRGSWIPTTSNTQIAAVIANWMGVNQANLGGLFPTLSNFPSPFEEATNLSFISGGLSL
jgi:uncharacterized protein (DUF1501 family)